MRVAWVPFAVGLAAIIQGGLNRQIATKWGLSSAVLLNTAVFTLLSVLFVWISRAHPEWFPQGFAPRTEGFEWWYLLPGVAGFALVVGIPYAISHLGATSVFVGIVSAQMVGSIIWDAVAEASPPTPTKIAGASLALLGAWLASR